jgi:hypothetical protein
VRLAVYGTSLFEAGGPDESGAGSWIFEGLEIGLFAWAAALLVIGVRTVYAWPVLRTLGALALAFLALVCFGLVFALF